MVGIRGKSGPPGNQNAFSTVYLESPSAVLTAFSIPQNNQSEKKSCPARWPDKGGAEQISTASDVSLLMIY
jgi:hypothetical protein